MSASANSTPAAPPPASSSSTPTPAASPRKRSRQAYRKALACDSTSAYGGIIALNRTLDADTARAITEIFTEVIIAPDATEEAIAIIAASEEPAAAAGRQPARSAHVRPDRKDRRRRPAGAEPRQRRGRGHGVEGRDQTRADRRRAARPQFAFRVAKHVKSNTIIYAKDLATVGIGAGQMSRVDSARIAARKAQDAAAELKLAEPLTKGSVVASDAFFPFADGMLACIEAGATAVIQPGGSMRDDEVIKAADEHGIAMVFTGVRHFRH